MNRDLRTYHDKRDFRRTQEPSGEAGIARDANRMFVVQKHAATRLHWDFRLEWQGVLLSWAVTRGPSGDPHAKRLAVRVEDHPLDYGSFEGTIPKGEYGGGTVMLWDTGTWAPLEDVEEGLAEGKLKFVLSGLRLKGAWALVRMKAKPGENRENWLLIKENDGHAMTETEGLVRAFDTSVTTGRSMAEIAAGKPHARARTKPATATSPAFRPVQLAKLVDAAPDGEDWLHEIKYDGYRCLAAIASHQVKLFTRSGLDWTAEFGVLVPEFEALTCQSALIDGEVIADVAKGAFSELQNRLKQGGALAFMAFDLLELNGTDLAGRPLSQRKAKLEALLASSTGTVRFSPHIGGHGPEVLAKACAAGQEGIIAKRAEAPYRGGRHDNWRKVKCGQRQEFVIGGWSGSTARGRPFASLLMGTFEDGELRYRGRVGTGFGEAEFVELVPLLKVRSLQASPFAEAAAKVPDAHWVKADLVAEIAFAELTADGNIRHGVYQGLRRDKEGPEVKLELAQAKMASGTTVKLKGIAISHPDRAVFAIPPVTKLQVAEHYAAFAGRILPFAKNRPLSLLRCPDGTTKQCFFQKHRGDGMHAAIGVVSVPGKTGSDDYISLNTAAGLVACVQMGTIEFHLWGASNDALELPDRLVFDLDPDEAVGFAEVRRAAAALRDRLDDLGLSSVPMLSGGKGVHVIVPLRPRAGWDSVKLFARTVASLIALAEPERFVAHMSKADRKGRIFIDWLRNERGATAVAPYVLRARPGAKVAVPVTWDELAQAKAAGDYDISSVRLRLDEPCPLRAATAHPSVLDHKVLEALERQIQT